VLIATVEGVALVFVSPTMARVVSLALTAIVIFFWPDGILEKRERP